MSRIYKECLHEVPSRGQPPREWLDTLIDAMLPLSDSLFAPNSYDDVYSLLAPVLGPWTGIPQRKAAMAEILRVLAGEESSWDWQCGADTTAGPETPAEEETGAFQVSQNSVLLDKTGGLAELLNQHLGSHTPALFIPAMKAEPALAVEYAIRLLRVSYRWDGPLLRGVVSRAVWKPAAAEFEGFLSQPNP